MTEPSPLRQAREAARNLDRDKAIKLWGHGLDVSTIALRLKRSTAMISDWLEEAGVRPKGTRRGRYVAVGGGYSAESGGRRVALRLSR